MIPTYNTGPFLEAALLSVLQQDPGPGSMQIEVVDDCSDQDDPELIVRKIGDGRVGFSRQKQNRGISHNLNSCVQRARGRWIHILHGDDEVEDGFYRLMARGLQDPSVGAALCRYAWIDEAGDVLGLSDQERPEPGLIQGWLERIAVSQLIQAPAIAVKRAVYEDVGGFLPSLSHAADWEMWKRIAVSYPYWFEPSPLASYRVRGGSHSDAGRTSGSNLKDIRLSIEVAATYLPPNQAPRLTRDARRHYARTALRIAWESLSQGRWRDYVTLIGEALRLNLSPLTLYWLFRLSASAIVRRARPVPLP